MLKILYIILLSVLSFGCSQKSEIEKHVEDIENVEEGIEVRQDMEEKIVIEENRALQILRENLAGANSDGMRDKVRREIRLKESVIEKSKNNLRNQEELLKNLRAKKDSLLEILKDTR